MMCAKDHPDSHGEPRPVKVIATNRKARYLYHIEDTWEAGIVLRGAEVKSMRAGGASLAESYAEATGNEVWINNLHVQPYEKANRFNVDPVRQRKLLLSRREIKKIIGHVAQRGYTLVPLRLYFRGQYAKLEIGLARGKKAFDKRQDIRERDGKRDMDRELKQRR